MDITSYLLGKQANKGGGASDYFNDVALTNAYNYSGAQHLIKKLPTIYINNTNSCKYLFAMCSNLEELEVDTNLGLITIPNMSYMFQGCYSLKKLKISPSIYRGNDLSNMFNGCNNLEHLDVRGLEFSYASVYSNIFAGVPKDCEIIVKNQTEKDWVLARRSDFTNVIIAD